LNNANRPAPSLSQSLMKNVAWNFIGQIWIALIGFFATPFIVRSLNVNLYGLYSLVWVIIGYFSFLQFGLGTASVKYISEYFAAGENENIRKIFWTCLVVYFFLGALGTLAIIFSAGFITAHFFKIPRELNGLAVTAIKLGGCGFLISMLTGVISGAVQAVGRFDILNRVGMLVGTLQLVLTVLLLAIGFSLKEIILSSLAVQLLGLCLLWIYAGKLLPCLARPAWSFFYLGRLFKFGGFVTISGFVGPILLNIDRIFLTSLRPLASLTYYSVPFSLMDKLSVIRSSFSSVLFPAFSSMEQGRENAAGSELQDRSRAYIFFLYAFFVVFFAISGRSFLSWWIGPDFAARSSLILAVLSLAGMINALAVPSSTALQGFNKPHIPAMFHVIETILYIPCAYFLIYRFGGTGAAFAWLLRVTLDTVLLQQAAARISGGSVLSWYAGLVKRGSVPVLAAAAVLSAVRSANPDFLSALNIGGIIAALAVYCSTVWHFGLDGFARKNIIELVRSKVHKH